MFEKINCETLLIFIEFHLFMKQVTITSTGCYCLYKIAEIDSG